MESEEQPGHERGMAQHHQGGNRIPRGPGEEAAGRFGSGDVHGEQRARHADEDILRPPPSRVAKRMQSRRDHAPNVCFRRTFYPREVIPLHCRRP